MRLTSIICVALALTCESACDPTHSDKVDALGDEAPGVNPGPTHRPGQPCMVCHDGASGDPEPFAVAGTIFETAGSAAPARGVDVQLTDSTGSAFAARTNEAGNFYVTPADWTPHYPMTAVVSAGKTKVTMSSLISRDGACAGCHVDPAGGGSPGRVALVLEDGGTPP